MKNDAKLTYKEKLNDFVNTRSLSEENCKRVYKLAVYLWIHNDHDIDKLRAEVNAE